MPDKRRYLRWVGIFNDDLKRDFYTDSFNKTLFDINAINFIEKFFNNCNNLNLLDTLLRTDVNTYLPFDLLVKVDITSMANSLEARSPFLDHKLMEFVASLPTGYKMKSFVKKYILKKIARDLIPRDNIHRRKMGFAVPEGEWFRNELKGFLYEILLSKKSLQRGYFRPECVRKIVHLHTEGKKDYSFQLWSLLMFELWYQRFID